MISNKYPYTNSHELNLDWVLKKLKECEERVRILEQKNEEGEKDV